MSFLVLKKIGYPYLRPKQQQLQTLWRCINKNLILKEDHMENMKFENFCFHNICQHHSSLNQWGCETYGSSLALVIHFNCVQFKLPLIKWCPLNALYKRSLPWTSLGGINEAEMNNHGKLQGQFAGSRIPEIRQSFGFGQLGVVNSWTVVVQRIGDPWRLHFVKSESPLRQFLT